MTHPEVEEWLRTAPGLHLNPDGSYGNQCVDVPDAFGEAIFGVPWNVCVGGVNGARELLDAAPDKYWIRVNNNPADPNQLPPRGAFCVTGGDASNPYGHVYAVLEARASGVTALQQDGFAAPHQFVNGNWYSAKPVHVAELPWYGAGIGTLLGWLIPRDEMIVDTGAAARLGIAIQPAPAERLEYQRESVAIGVNYRKAPDPSGELLRLLEGGKLYDFKGFVKRTPVDGNDVWFVGRYSDGFAHSSGFTDQSTAGLPDLTATLFPAPATPVSPTSNKRITGQDGVNRRKGPDKNADLIDTFGPDLELTLGGWVEGTDPYGQGNKIWFVGGISGGYMHSSGFTSASTAGLPKLPAPETVAPPAPKPVYDFVPDFDWVEKIPANLTNVELGRAPAKDGKTVIHQMGTPGRDTLGSTINEFKRENSFKSTHFATEGSRCVQMVSLKDRAYHAGTVGNGYVGIETDPYQTAESIATTVKLLAGLKALGYSTVYIRHKDVEGNNTACGTLINLDSYRIVEVVTPPVTTPPPAPVGPDADQVQVFLDWLKDSFTKRAS
jgi:hypothetical protein